MFLANVNSNKVIMSADKTELVVLNVCKDCDDGTTTDLCVLQCNATNAYGYTFAEGYLNVLRKYNIANHLNGQR